VDIPKLDCFRLLLELKDAGVSNNEVARRLGVPPTTVQGWKAGAEPRWSDGERLRQLHAYAAQSYGKPNGTQ
jgi:CENP-B N-terminal DNA-binding domain